MQHPTSADIQRVRDFLLDLQARICAALNSRNVPVAARLNS